MNEKKSMNKLVIVVSGGAIASIFSDLDTKVDIEIVDYDEVGEDGLEEEELDERLNELTSGLKEIF